jgi:hypothetical protein
VTIVSIRWVGCLVRIGLFYSFYLPGWHPLNLNKLIQPNLTRSGGVAQWHRNRLWNRGSLVLIPPWSKVYRDGDIYTVETLFAFKMPNLAVVIMPVLLSSAGKRFVTNAAMF